jgi:hypothetical protein
MDMKDLSFEQWMNAVDDALVSRIGLSSDDLEDQNYFDMYEDGYSPKTAAKEVLENIDFL